MKQTNTLVSPQKEAGCESKEGIWAELEEDSSRGDCFVLDWRTWAWHYTMSGNVNGEAEAECIGEKITDSTGFLR